MDTRQKQNPVDELRIQIDAVAAKIDEVIHLDAMCAALKRAGDQLQQAQLKQREFYEEDKLSLTPDNLKFLNNTVRGNEYRQKIISISRDISSIEKNIIDLEHQKAIRMKPLNDLWDHVTNPRVEINQQYVKTLLSNAKVLNPEGSLIDMIQSIGEMIKSVITFRAYELPGIYHGQVKKNDLHSSIARLFKRDNTELKATQQAAVKPGLSRQ